MFTIWKVSPWMTEKPNLRRKSFATMPTIAVISVMRLKYINESNGDDGLSKNHINQCYSGGRTVYALHPNRLWGESISFKTVWDLDDMCLLFWELDICVYCFEILIFVYCFEILMICVYCFEILICVYCFEILMICVFCFEILICVYSFRVQRTRLGFSSSIVKMLTSSGN